VRRAFRFRDALLHRLHVRKQGHAYIVLGAPTHAERMAWCEALGKVVDVIVLDVPMNVCISRIQAEPLRAHAAPQQIDAVVQWWKHYQANGKPNNINGIGGRVKKYRLNPELRRAGTDTGNYFS
jgi:hypothetical protein